MQSNVRLTLAIQKKGRLNNDSLELLKKCGLKLLSSKSSLFYSAENFPIDILLVRDDDIPTLIRDGVCDLGIVGENVIQEQVSDENEYESLKLLGFGRCRLSIALPKDTSFNDINQLQNARIATSYPNLLQRFLSLNNIKASLVSISGSVEISPKLGIADAICDLVSTGKTLEENNLQEVAVILQSQAALIKAKAALSTEKQAILEIFLRRITGVMQAQESKYILFHAPKNAIARIEQLLPGNETPTIMPLAGNDEKVAIHVVSREAVFWGTLEKLREAGATAILVLPVEKMMY
ncbi:ATP phosphoribosyltransferase [Candidatus Berkiella aquae]|uniref:ATP phosphoribosyltransferase n=1 Tax=Candidatus Berkiella aquae TaxID=295108 RepID=A0A0Q9YMI1_9GAMM|nr:ATP phosphoribosyltransferase [Candidatus Berkiella aquae]MCS5710404.1 ATP phosphoribosyltransferase [Candidatus Berkiella aquae]